MMSAEVIVPDDCIRNKVGRRLNTDEAAGGQNIFASMPPIAAFTCGVEWLNA